MSTGNLSRVKAWFVVPFLVLQLATSIVATAAVLTGAAGSDPACWLPALAVSATFLGFMGWLMFSGRARTAPRLPALSGTAVLGVVLAGSCALVHGQQALLPLVLTLAGATGTLLYVFWYSRLDRPAAVALRVGARLPDFTLRELSGRKLQSEAMTGRPAILLFYRGNWCPLCSAQVHELARGYRELESAGARVYLISPQPREESMALAARFDVPLEFLVDEESQVARRLGIHHARGVPAGVA